jgi:flagellin FlaB
MKFMRNEEAFTGLEAAIVLIAFVVVAAVFSYVMLGAGFFTSQKSQEVVHTSVAQASSSVEIVGNVIGNGDTTNHNITSVDFTIGTTAGGGSFDLNTVVITYRDNGTYFSIPANTTSITAAGVNETTPQSNEWAVIKYLNSQDDTSVYDGDVLVESGEQVVLEVNISGTTAKAIPNNQFSIELRPAVGAPLLIQKTVPPQIDAVNILY